MRKPVTQKEEQLFAVNSFVYYMANHWCLEESIRIFGRRMGTHFFSKWVSLGERQSADHATLGLWYAMEDGYRQVLIEAAVSRYEAEVIIV